MAVDVVASRLQACYAVLLRLYPQAFQHRFGEELAQTFQDLCRERRSAQRGLYGLALWIFFDTFVGIIRENTTDMNPLAKAIVRAALIALGLLMVPAVASQLVEGWHWGVGGFVFAYVMFFGTALAYGLIAGAKGSWAYKAGVGVALVAGFVMGWSSMVATSESENPWNLLYIGVLVVGGVGAALARLEASGMARALFAMAAALTVVCAVLWSNAPMGPVRYMVTHGVFVAIFAGAGLLFRHASRQPATVR